MASIIRMLLSVALVAPNAAIAEGSKSHEQMTAETRAVMERYMAAQNADEYSFKEIVSFYHKDLKAIYYMQDGIRRHESAEDYYNTWNADNITEFRFDLDYTGWSEPLLTIIDGETAAVRYIGHSRTVDGAYYNHYIHLYTVRDGKIVEYHAIMNPHSGAHYARNKQMLLDFGLYKGDK
ncbi:MAG: nuclear transport factor 2 family protein [Chloroflexota bacterium]|nr:nuclear transport factor 2 family protein [Chloroflexota bacterium]